MQVGKAPNGLHLLRWALFWVAAFALLALGTLGSQLLWFATHHRYDDPATGLYHGLVDARFAGMDSPIYSFSFRGKSEPHWYWIKPTNFVYTKLEVDWYSEAGSEKATVLLPSFEYRTAVSTGLLTKSVLARWIADDGAAGIPEVDSQTESPVDVVWNHFHMAASGKLPRPQHHGHNSYTPFHCVVYHFRLGIGIGSYVYGWVLLWTGLVAWAIARNRRITTTRHQGAIT